MKDIVLIKEIGGFTIGYDENSNQFIAQYADGSELGTSKDFKKLKALCLKNSIDFKKEKAYKIPWFHDVIDFVEKIELEPVEITGIYVNSIEGDRDIDYNITKSDGTRHKISDYYLYQYSDDNVKIIENLKKKIQNSKIYQEYLKSNAELQKAEKDVEDSINQRDRLRDNVYDKVNTLRAHFNEKIEEMKKQLIPTETTRLRKAIREV